MNPHLKEGDFYGIVKKVTGVALTEQVKKEVEKIGD